MDDGGAPAAPVRPDVPQQIVVVNPKRNLLSSLVRKQNVKVGMILDTNPTNAVSTVTRMVILGNIVRRCKLI